MERKDTDSSMQEIRLLEQKLTELPVGYISKKKINGKQYFYHQWTEDHKKKSRYLPADEVETLEAQIALRKKVQMQLKSLRAKMPDAAFLKARSMHFETGVTTGMPLRMMGEGVKDWERRECYSQLEAYLYGKQSDRICLLFGLRRTGKTTMLRQALGDMSTENLSRTAYIKVRRTDTMAMVNRDLIKLQEAGFQFVFLDEVTLMQDFIDSAALFSDVFAAMGMKIVLSGTDSLGFWLTMDEELYDRATLIHTTFIPYREYSRLLGLHGIDAYIRYGGTLRAGEIAFDDANLNAEDASFRDDESTRRYIDTAICKNIQHSLACYENGGHFRHLYDLYATGELTSAINRIIEDMNHRFVLQVLTDDFVSHDLGQTAKNLRKERDPVKRTTVLDTIDTVTVTQRLMKILEIRNREIQSVGITPAHVAEIQEYLHALDLILDCPVETAVPGITPVTHVLFTQPGMRYCQAQALVYVLMQDETFLLLGEDEKCRIADRILTDVRGRMMEDIVLLETMKCKAKHQRVFKLQFPAGEFDMVIYDSEKHQCSIFEIKHSDKVVPAQYRHLLDAEKCSRTERRFGPIVGRYVLYRGEDYTTEEGVQYRNVEAYLKDYTVPL